jgi:chloramphenicol 3-O phosphotransferase
LNRRETARGDREIGLAAGQTDKIIPKDDYDLVVDTHALTTEECARRIMDLIANPQSINTFKKLTSKINL